MWVGVYGLVHEINDAVFQVIDTLGNVVSDVPKTGPVVVVFVAQFQEGI